MNHHLLPLIPTAVRAFLRRTPPAELPSPPKVPLGVMYAGYRRTPPASVGLLVQHWHHCPVHGTQLVSVLDPGCACTP